MKFLGLSKPMEDLSPLEQDRLLDDADVKGISEVERTSAKVTITAPSQGSADIEAEDQGQLWRLTKPSGSPRDAAKPLLDSCAHEQYQTAAELLATTSRARFREHGCELDACLRLLGFADPVAEEDARWRAVIDQADVSHVKANGKGSATVVIRVPAHGSRRIELSGTATAGSSTRPSKRSGGSSPSGACEGSEIAHNVGPDSRPPTAMRATTASRSAPKRAHEPEASRRLVSARKRRQSLLRRALRRETVRWLLGRRAAPGGNATTLRLAELAGVRPDKQRSVAEMARVLRPEGRSAIADVTADAEERRDRDPHTTTNRVEAARSGTSCSSPPRATVRTT